jgi:hypothetical protein
MDYRTLGLEPLQDSARFVFIFSSDRESTQRGF